MWHVKGYCHRPHRLRSANPANRATDRPVEITRFAESPVIAGPTGAFFDCSVGAQIVFRPVNLAVAYVNTDIDRTKANGFFAVGGRRVVSGALVASVTADF